MVYDKLNKYPYTLAASYNPKVLTANYEFTKAVMLEVTNFRSLKEEGVPNRVAPCTLLDWWHYLIDFTERHPQINFASDLFSWLIFKKHFARLVDKHHNCLLMILDPLSTGNLTYETLTFTSHHLLKVFVGDPLAHLKNPKIPLPPLVVFRDTHPNFQAYIINSEGRPRSIGVFTNPDAANRARVREQVKHLDKLIETLTSEAEESLKPLEAKLLQKLRNSFLRGLQESLEVSYPVTPKMAAIIFEAQKTKRSQQLYTSGPSLEEVMENMNRCATDKIIQEVNSELRRSAKHLRSSANVIGETYAYEYTQEFLEERSTLNRRAIKTRRNIAERKELEIEKQVEVDADTYGDVSTLETSPRKRVYKPKPELPDEPISVERRGFRVRPTKPPTLGAN